MSLFDGSQPFKIDKPIRLIELFAGIGSQAKALKNIGADFEHYRICEFDEYAVQSYNAVHGTDFKTSDITKITADDLGIVDTDKYCYVMTYSFPCQDLSNAGLGKGMAKGSGTRSGLLWEVERLLDECKDLPQVLVMENVPAVIGAKNIQHFAKWQEKLENLGFKNKWQVLNAKDFGIPQNRERCFMVSLLGDYYYEFPKTIPLKLRLKDMLEKEVEEKYYLSSTGVDYFAKKIDTFNDKRFDYIQPYVVSNNHGTFTGEINDCNIHPTLTTDTSPAWKQVLLEEPKLDQIAQLTDKKYNEMASRVYSDKGLCPTIRTMQGGGLEPKVAEPIAYDEQNQYLRTDGCVGTLTTDGSSPKHNNRIVEWVESVGEYTCPICGKSFEYVSNYCPNCGNKLNEPLVWDGYNQRVRADSELVGTLTQNCGADLKRNGQGIIEPICKYELSDKMKRYINSYDDSYKVSDGNLVVNRDIAVAKTTREGSTRADASDYISAEIEPNKNIAKMDCTQFRIRKLTPKECWRLMGFADEDVDNAVAVGMSNAQLYKQAGNSICVPVLEYIFKQML